MIETNTHPILMITEWFYISSTGESRTTTEDQFSALIADGTLTARTQVWRRGLPSWITAGEALTNLFSVTGSAAVPPPLP